MKGWTPGRVAAVATIVALAGFWFFAFVIADTPRPNQLEDPTFARKAEPVCAAVRAELVTMPRADEASTADERSQVVREATARLSTMLDDLEEIAPPASDEADGWIHEWIADYRIYLDDRIRYAEALLTDPEARFLLTVLEGERDRPTQDLDQVALINDMDSCATPGDV